MPHVRSIRRGLINKRRESNQEDEVHQIQTNRRAKTDEEGGEFSGGRNVCGKAGVLYSLKNMRQIHAVGLKNLCRRGGNENTRGMLAVTWPVFMSLQRAVVVTVWRLIKRIDRFMS